EPLPGAERWLGTAAKHSGAIENFVALGSREQVSAIFYTTLSQNELLTGRIAITNGSTSGLTLSGNTTNLNVMSNSVAIFDQNQVLTNSIVTAQELSFLSGLTNSIIDLLAGKLGADDLQSGLAPLQTQLTNKMDALNGTA